MAQSVMSEDEVRLMKFKQIGMVKQPTEEMIEGWIACHTENYITDRTCRQLDNLSQQIRKGLFDGELIQTIVLDEVVAKVTIEIEPKRDPIGLTH